jgi:hypothetical protein
LIYVTQKKPLRSFGKLTNNTKRRDVGINEILYRGLREGDWFFSENKEWVLPNDQIGLSFSSSYANLKDVYRLKGKWNPGAQINVHWVLERPDIPTCFNFVEHRGKSGHYFLTITEPMLLDTLVKNLKLLARKMSVFRGCK